MFVSKFGAFDGASWEGLCQQVFKRKYEVDGYQEMKASPGDFGIEGFTVNTGWAFQCYCPDKHYERSELYRHIREKITEDIGKLEKYKNELEKRLGQTKICRWIFVTPEVDKNEILVHSRNKEQEMRSKGLSIIASDFTVFIYDGEHFIVEINELRAASGESLVFDEMPPVLSELKGEQEEYEKNVQRKSTARLAQRKDKPDFQARVNQLSQLTIESFLSSDGFFKRIEATSPITYVKLVRIINEYEQHVIETSATWSATAEELTEKVREGLAQRINQELAEFDLTLAHKVARYMTARWLAVCELSYD